MPLVVSNGCDKHRISYIILTVRHTNQILHSTPNRLWWPTVPFLQQEVPFGVKPLQGRLNVAPGRLPGGDRAALPGSYHTMNVQLNAEVGKSDYV